MGGRWRVLVALCVGVVVVFQVGSAAAVRAKPLLASAGEGRVSSLASAPLALQEAVADKLRGSVWFAVTKNRSGLEVRSGLLSASFGRSGPALSVLGGGVTLALTGIGYRGALADSGTAIPVSVGRRVVYRRGEGVSEWYRSGPLGIEQGFTLGRRPSSRGRGGPLTIVVGSTGSLRPRQNGSSISFVSGDDHSRVMLRLRDLSVFDGLGHLLPS